jgi:hypothetical protein
MSRTTAVVQEPGIPLLLRIIYFFLFGWWAAGIWMFNRLPALTTLMRM